MIKVLKFLVLMVMVVGLTGCGTLHINRIVTGTECLTREDCIRDLGLDRQPANPDIVFVVEPLLMKEKGKAPIGWASPISSTNYGYVELCVAKALREEFKNAKIVFDDKDANMPFVRIKLHDIAQQATYPFGGYVRINYDLIINGKTHSLYAKSGTAIAVTFQQHMRDHYPRTCQILAKQVRETLENKGIAVPATLNLPVPETQQIGTKIIKTEE